MSRIDYISIEGLRIDGRRKDEPRNTKLFFGSETSVDYLNYDGVSEILQGLNKVQVLIKGPSEVPSYIHTVYTHSTYIYYIYFKNYIYYIMCNDV